MLLLHAAEPQPKTALERNQSEKRTPSSHDPHISARPNKLMTPRAGVNSARFGIMFLGLFTVWRSF